MSTCEGLQSSELRIEVIARGAVPEGEVSRAEWVIGRVLRRHRIVTDARVRLTRLPHEEGQLVVQVNLRAFGVDMRAQSGGPGSFALTFAAERLDRQMHRLATGAGPRSWPDPSRPPLAVVTDDRPIVRRKAGDPLACDVADAISVMDEMDYDACLFTDKVADEDAVVYWSGPLGVRLARQRRMRPPEQAQQLGLTVNPHPTRTLDEGEAVARLCGYGLPFLFFTDSDDGRGRLLYRRYDGDLGIVTGGSAPVIS